MPITATYEVQCDACWGVMDGRYETRKDAEKARDEMGWKDLNGGTACPRTTPPPTPPPRSE
ncbi:hypothetical protein ACGFZU_06650 [Streptomyces tendae]|uniref:hypothetical protein n=1 Tax=Streptomyces tendae TaxID=1932 RepID=UPI0037212D06